jgi:hypothetical protein
MNEIKQESDGLIDCKAKKEIERERERERERDGENTKKERRNYLLCWQISNLEQFQRRSICDPAPAATQGRKKRNNFR